MAFVILGLTPTFAADTVVDEEVVVVVSAVVLLIIAKKQSKQEIEIIKNTPDYAFLKKLIDKGERYPMFLEGFFSSEYEKFKRCYGQYAKISNGE